MAAGTDSRAQTRFQRVPGAALPAFWDTPGFLEAALVCVSVLVFVSTLSFGFVYDDRVQILDNPFIQSWKYAAHDFTSDVWAQTNRHPIQFYRPVFLAWLRLNHTIFGVTPWGWHLGAVLLHALATLMVFRLASHLLRDRLTAAMAALVFAVHPIHVESVAWVSGAVDPLMSLFFLASLLAFLRWCDSGTGRWLATSLLCGLLAMLTKEPAIVLPAVVFVLAGIVPGEGRARGVKPALAQAAPFVLLALVYLAIRFAVLKSGSPVSAGYSTILLTLPGLLLFYLRLVVWPVGLSLFYDRHFVTAFGFGTVVVPVVVILGIAAVGLVLVRLTARARVAAFAALFALSVLAPALWIRWFPNDDFVHDRYVYLPLAGFTILFATLIADVGRDPTLQPNVPRVRVLVAAAVAIPLAIGTVSQQMVWADDLLLWFHCYKRAPHNQWVLNNLASSLGERGEYKTAIPLFVEVLQKHPDNAYAQGNLGFTYYQLGDLRAAEEHLGQAVRLDPADAHSLLYLGFAHFKQGDLADAQAELTRAIQMDPSAKGAHLALSFVLEQQGDRGAALREARAELAQHPDEAQARERVQQLQGGK